MKTVLLDFDTKNIRQVAGIVLQTAEEHGFVEFPCNIDQKLLLITGEIAEAQNELRDGHAVDEIYWKPDHSADLALEGKPEGFVIELADAVIRIFDLAAELGLDIQEAIRLKAIYNDSRPYKHGKKF